MMERWLWFSSLVFTSLGACVGCEAVPDIVYVTDDAGTSPDGDAALPDGNTCPTLVPSYATACCGVIPCAGANCVATCADCQTCSPLDLCCPNSQNHAICRASLQCP